MTSERPLKKIIVALDQMTPPEIDYFLQKNKHTFPLVKVGLELFCAYGPVYVAQLHHKYGVEVFLDLKLHDIPNTVKKAIQSLSGLPIKFLSIHLAGGREMIKQALEQTKVSLPQTTLLGISFLTSLEDKDFAEIWNLNTKSQEHFKKIFELGFNSQIPGLVLSAQELSVLKNLEISQGQKVIKVCPGIRFSEEIEKGETQDQKRPLSPESAIKEGADFLVIGRSLTTASPENLKRRVKELQDLFQ